MNYRRCIIIIIIVIKKKIEIINFFKQSKKELNTSFTIFPSNEVKKSIIINLLHNCTVDILITSVNCKHCRFTNVLKFPSPFCFGLLFLSRRLMVVVNYQFADVFRVCNWLSSWFRFTMTWFRVVKNVLVDQFVLILS
jgi:hypothetical protein